MGSSYFITYGGNRVTFPGTPGPVAWSEPMVDVNLSMDKSWLKMRFVDSTGGETSMEVGSSLSASASASVPRNSTAYWTANGYQGYETSKYHVTAFLASGFAGVSADTSVTTAFYTNPSVSSYGSAILTASDTASAHISNGVAYKTTYGEGGTSFYTRVSASSWAGEYSGPWGTAAGNVMWIPSGAKVVYSASSVAGRTYNVQTNSTGLSAYEIVYAHGGPGTHSTVSGYMNAAYNFRLGNGRTKNVYATGTAYQLSMANSASAATWQPACLIVSFSSNLNTDSATGTFLVGSGNVNKVYGFTGDTLLGAVKNSAGTWSSLNDGNGTIRYRWSNNNHWVSNSGYMSGYFSAMRHKGATGNNTDTYAFYGRNTAGATYVVKSGTFAVPTASGKTSTLTATASASLAGASACAVHCFSNSVAQSTVLRTNCRGAWTASGIVQ